MSRRIVYSMVLIASIGCGQREPDLTEQPPAGTPAEQSSAAVSGSATGEGKSFTPTWGIALWDDEEEGELVLGFLESKPTADQLESILENKSLFMGVFLEVPVLEFGIKFEGTNGTPDISKPGFCTVLYHNFGDQGPMTLNRSASLGVVNIAGTLKPGGQVNGQVQGDDLFEAGDDKREYKWNLKFNLPVQ